LTACETDRISAELPDRHREQRHRDALSRREQHIQLPAIRIDGDALGERQQLVGRIAHRRDYDGDIEASRLGPHDPFGHLSNAIDVGDAASAVLLNDYRHEANRVK
jgi:hypothetical protein